MGYHKLSVIGSSLMDDDAAAETLQHSSFYTQPYSEVETCHPLGYNYTSSIASGTLVSDRTYGPLGASGSGLSNAFIGPGWGLGMAWARAMEQMAGMMAMGTALD